MKNFFTLHDTNDLPAFREFLNQREDLNMVRNLKPDRNGDTIIGLFHDKDKRGLIKIPKDCTDIASEMVTEINKLPLFIKYRGFLDNV